MGLFGLVFVVCVCKIFVVVVRLFFCCFFFFVLFCLFLFYFPSCPEIINASFFNETQQDISSWVRHLRS